MASIKVVLQPEFAGHQKPIEKWSVLDFVKYFSTLLIFHEYPPLKIPNVAWRAYGGRTRQFLDSTKISNAQYKRYLEFLFSPELRDAHFVPTFSSAVSKRSYFRVAKLLKEDALLNTKEYSKSSKQGKSINYSDNYFRSLAEELRKSE